MNEQELIDGYGEFLDRAISDSNWRISVFADNWYLRLNNSRAIELKFIWFGLYLEVDFIKYTPAGGYSLDRTDVFRMLVKSKASLEIKRKLKAKLKDQEIRDNAEELKEAIDFLEGNK